MYQIYLYMQVWSIEKPTAHTALGLHQKYSKNSAIFTFVLLRSSRYAVNVVFILVQKPNSTRGGSYLLCLKYKLAFQLTVRTQPLYVVVFNSLPTDKEVCDYRLT